MLSRYYGEANRVLDELERRLAERRLAEYKASILFENRELARIRKVPVLWDYYQDQKGGSCNGN